ncbi:MAG: hypothetical protein J7L08_00550, partial [Candidatus Aenigmarchaeota archaeon]|nr:hypothetical protein [Candidatus Aenigmarchaeota archaeon]
ICEIIIISMLEEGIILSVNEDKGKVKIGNRIREVKIDPAKNYKEGDKVRVIMGLVIDKVIQ